MPRAEARAVTALVDAVAVVAAVEPAAALAPLAFLSLPRAFSSSISILPSSSHPTEIFGGLPASAAENESAATAET